MDLDLAEPLTVPLTTSDLIAYAAGLLLMLSFLPQIIKIWRLREARDVSMLMAVITTVSTLLFLTYSIRENIMTLIIINALFLISNLALIASKLLIDGLGNEGPPERGGKDGD